MKQINWIKLKSEYNTDKRTKQTIKNISICYVGESEIGRGFPTVSLFMFIQFIIGFFSASSSEVMSFLVVFPLLAGSDT